MVRPFRFFYRLCMLASSMFLAWCVCVCVCLSRVFRARVVEADLGGVVSFVTVNGRCVPRVFCFQAKVMNFNSENKHTSSPRRAPTWVQYYFRLREGVLTKSPPRRSSFPSTSSQLEDMVLSGETKTSYTNTKNCFCVRTGDVRWA